MEYETEEQQVDALKAWWKENGKAVIAGVVIGASLIGGWSWYKQHQENQAVAASDAFSQSMQAAAAGELDKVSVLASELADDQPKTLYAAYANLAAAKAAVEADNLDLAVEKLSWVSESASQSDVKLIATIRLARVKSSLGDVAGALALLPNTYPSEFTGLVEEARGDLHVAAGDASAARAAYQQAQSSDNIANSAALTMKINELVSSGGSS